MRLADTSQEVLLDTASRFLIPGIVFVLTLVSGVWLSRSGKPLDTGIFTVHKLIALGAVVATAIQTYHALKGGEIQTILSAEKKNSDTRHDLSATKRYDLSPCRSRGHDWHSAPCSPISLD